MSGNDGVHRARDSERAECGEAYRREGRSDVFK